VADPALLLLVPERVKVEAEEPWYGVQVGHGERGGAGVAQRGDDAARLAARAHHVAGRQQHWASHQPVDVRLHQSRSNMKSV
jgi:hypothetical protein